MNMQTRCFGYPFGLDVVSSPHRVLSVEAASRDYVWSNARVRCVRLDSIVSCMAWVTLWSLSSSVAATFSAGRREVFVAVVSRVALPLYRSCSMELDDRLRLGDVCWICEVAGLVGALQF
jgi:hypothetical protein